MKTLIAIVSAVHRKYWRDAIRSTWLPLVPENGADVRFFMAGNPDNEERVVVVNCDDSYKGLPEKIREIARWALNNGYDYMLKCDDDVVLRPRALLDSGYQNHKYSGKTNRYLQEFNVPVGFNWWINRECMEIVSNSELPEDGSNDDEKWVARKLSEKGITLVHDHRYEIHMGEIPSRDDYPIHRPLRPPRVGTKYTTDVFSWTIFLEADSGDGIPLEKKLQEFHKVFSKVGGT